jgi:hypothetical protein
MGPIIISRAQNTDTLITGLCILGLPFGSQTVMYAVPSEILTRRHRAWAQNQRLQQYWRPGGFTDGGVSSRAAI